MTGLVLSLFSGMGALDEGFRRAGYCVVSAGDVAWSSLYDVRHFYPPAGVFDGVIGGDPCQSHSALANLVRAKGLEPSFPDMTPELVRVVEEARPRWFLRENVPGAPDAKPAGYDVRSFLLDHSTLDSGDGTGHEQMRRRRFWFGVRDGTAPELRAHIDFALFVLPDTKTAVCAGNDGKWPYQGMSAAQAAEARKLELAENPDQRVGSDGRRLRAIEAKLRVQAIACDSRAVPVAIGGSGKRKQTVSGRHTSHGMGGDPETTRGNHAGNPPRYSLDEMLRLQGLPEDVFRWSPLTMQGKRKLVGNAVPLGMAEALARAIREATA